MERNPGTGDTAHGTIDREEPTGPEIPPAPLEAGRRTRRRLIAIVASASAFLVVLAVIGLVLTPGPLGGSDVILDEHFDPGDPPTFSTDSDPAVDLEVVGGAYRATVKDPTAPQLVRHVFLRTRDGVSFEATIDIDTEGWAIASVACWSGDSAYLFALTDGGEVMVIETVHEATGERRSLTPPIETTAARPGQPTRLRIDCVGGGTDPSVISGYVNGEPAVSLSIDDGYDSFLAVGFFLVTDTGGTTFTIDDVLVTEGRPAAPVSPVPPTVTALPTPPATPAPAVEDSPTVDASTESDASDGGCVGVFSDARRALEQDDGTTASDIVSFGTPMECASFAEARTAAIEVFGPGGARGLRAYLTRTCTDVGPSAGLRETDLCRELTAA